MMIRRCVLGVLAVSYCHFAAVFAAESESGTPPAEVKRFFDQQGKVVVTFLGYSGAGYEDVDNMLDEARDVLSVHSPKKAIVNIGATSSGIGAVYEIAKKMGFETTGIVSTQAKKYNAEISPYVDKVFFIADDSWGGFVEGSDGKILSPTSQAMVRCSDVVVCIGGGLVARDELIVAEREGKTTKYIAAEMNHKTAIDKARKKRQPVPTDFKGAAFGVFGKPARSEQ